jgi:GGDEF domain-containing protein
MTFDDISGFVRAGDQLRELAGVDELTKLPNRRHFLKSLETEFARVQRLMRPSSTPSRRSSGSGHFRYTGLI